jgi:hypothetical protein
VTARRWLPFTLAALVRLVAPPAAAAQDATPSPHGALQEACTDCHGASGWKPARVSASFDHTSASKGFALAGAHARTTCRACHVSLDFRGASRDCVGCHSDVHRGELGSDCARCHTPRSFLDRAAMVRAHQASRFALTGAHVTADCESCHVPSAQGRLTFVNRPTDCVQCHADAYRAAKEPDHVAGGFPQDCNQCHATSTWPRARFNHAATRFPLTGAHRSTPCLQCHGDGIYRGKDAACASCHQSAYDGTTDPSHRAAQFPTTCATCHTTTAWQPASFDHSATAFPLTGAHRAVSCVSCHGDGVYVGKSSACASCHQPDYDGTTDPSHRAAQFSTDCTVCHTTTTWSGATFDHAASAFPLTGAHVAATCQQCHGDGVYAGKNTACVSCHQSAYDGTTDPAHQGAQFPTTCQDCHTTTAWSGARFDHDAPYFPIYSGAHAGRWASCATCHTNAANFQAFTCLTCHEHAKSTMDSKHSGRSGYVYDSQACYTCHPRGRAD